MTTLPRLTAAQAAARLGVKPESLYAYVSRGLLARQRTAAGSTFDPLEIEVFAQRRRASRPPGVAPRVPAPGSPLMVLDTDIAFIEDDELFFRGRPVADVVDAPFADSAAWLWRIEPTALRTPDRADVAAAHRATTSLPAHATILDRIGVIVTALAATDPLRDHTAPDDLARVGGRLLAGVPAALAAPGPEDPFDVPRVLWRALAGRGPTDRQAGTMRAALALLIDHDLAVSTLAARVAASARGSGYAVVTAALGAFDTPLHGSASRRAVELLRRIRDGAAPAAALESAVSRAPGIPGFGQPLYAAGDIRARLLLDRMRAHDAAVCDIVDAIAAEVLGRADLRPNIDLALAAMVVEHDLPDDAGSAVFAVGRLVGWIAHAIAETDERPLRLRPSGRYVGPPPG